MICVQGFATWILRSHCLLICAWCPNLFARSAAGLCTITLANIPSEFCYCSASQGASLTRCLRRLHLLQARFTRDFRDADVDVPDVVLAIDTVRTASRPYSPSNGPVVAVAATAVPDDLAPPEDELSRSSMWVCADAVLSTVSL